MAEKKTRTRRKVDTKTKPAPAQSTLLTLFGKRPSDNGESPTEPSSEVDKPASSKPKFNARVIVRTTSSGASSVTGKRRREESGSPVVTPPRPRSRSPLVIPSSSPPPTRSSSPPLVLSSSPQAVRSSSPVILDSPISSPPPSPPPTRQRLAVEGDTTDSDGLGLTTHPFFAKAKDKAPKGKLQRTSKDQDKGKSKTQTAQGEGSQDAPIEIGEEEEAKSGPVHSFFKPRKAPQSVFERTASNEGGKGKGKGKERESAAERWKKAAGVDPLWPNSESIHAGCGTASYESKPCPIPRRTTGPSKTTVSDEATRAWSESYRHSQKEDDLLKMSTGWFDGWAGLRRPAGGEEDIPPEHAAHPAIARLLDPTTGPQYAFAPPTNASEILGSKNEVDELKEWLHKLAIKRKQMAEQEEQAKEPVNEDLDLGPRKVKRVERDVIQTRLAKPKKRKERQDEYDPDIVVDDDWIEPDTEDITVVYEKVVGNTMVVLGPPGIGKSAAIHACAQELGWSVFEVYAGIGRRGIGANGLAGLIGSVGTNHTVGSEKETQESLILLDDVDQVFEQDTQFWSAVETLIGDSKRAVVMTCNDMYAVREGQLAIERYLELDTADPDLASSYLYAQARAARGPDAKLPSREAFRALYKATSHTPRLPDFAVPDMATHAVTSQMDRLTDLRRALEETKFWVMHGRGCVVREEREPIDVREAWAWYGRDVVEHLGDWSVAPIVQESRNPEPVVAMRLWRFADTLSWADAWMERRWPRQMQAAEVDRMEPTSDDTTVYHELCKPPVRMEEFGIAEHCADADMSLAALWLARRRLERGAGSGARFGLERVRHWDARWLDDKRLTHQENCMVFLEKHILSPATPQPPHPAVALDIVPVVRRIVAADNEFEALGEAREERRTRTRAGRQKYVRYLTLQEPKKQGLALEMIRATEYPLM